MSRLRYSIGVLCYGCWVAFCCVGWGICGLAQSKLLPADPVPDLATPERYQSMKSFAKALYYIEKMYVDEEKVNLESLMQDALKGLIENLDPHSSLLSKEDYVAMHQGQKQFGGVGIIVSYQDGKIIVVSPIENSPAMRSGIQSGDEIVAIDGIPVSQLGTDEAVEKMKDVPGTKITLTVKRGKSERHLKFELVREVIKVKSVRSFQLSKNILVIRIASFTRNVSKDLRHILEKYKGTLKGLVLDLRDNPGGLLSEAVAVTDTFISSGLIVSTVGRQEDQVEREFAQLSGTYEGFPMVTLINGGSASASEIVAGALQDHRRSVILGTKSFGKGSVQTLVHLPNGSALKLTIARYYTPLDRSIQAKGIVPDVRVGRKQVGVHPAPIRREEDLEGHIVGEDLSDLSRGASIAAAIRKWPTPVQEDYQLVTAFSYIQGWVMFDGYRQSATALPPIDLYHQSRPVEALQ
ncbi:MAG: S41 family peptidase [Zetaproteobacteria bacterium]|nr:S41 family peptidase [Zetaproteobacteria bacterium]